MLSTAIWAQEFPVEIELVPPPPDAGFTFTILSVPDAPAPEPEWTPPPRPCRVCKEMKADDACPCDEPLTQSLANVLLKQVKRAVSSATGKRITLSRPVSIRAVSSQKLRQMGGERLLGLYEDDVIWVSYDLNRRQATAVIAHELGHAWFFQHRSDVNTPTELLFEGFAEWVCFLTLRELGDLDGASRIEHADQSVYGRGARRLIARHRADGLEAVLSLVLQGRTL
jgi:hypothetical protein